MPPFFETDRWSCEDEFIEGCDPLVPFFLRGGCQMVNRSVRHDDTEYVVVPFDLLVVADNGDARLQANAS